jgi:membrane associated rhomboid family serine protease
MLIIPLTGNISKKNPPVVTIAIILICCFVYFVLQANDARKYREAHEFYLHSGLAKIEVSTYLTYLGTTKQDKRAEALAKRGELREQVLLAYWQRMFGDAEFLHKLLNDEMITPGRKGYPEWKQLRREYDGIMSQVVAVRYGFKPASPGYVSAVTHIFLHGSFLHLLGNMIFLWLVGCALELGYGRLLYTGMYLLTGLLAVGLYYLVYVTNTRPLIGASGAIAGLMGAYTLLYGLKRIKVFYSVGFYFNYTRVPALVLLPLWIANECFQLKFGGPSHVAYVAHLGGLTGGSLLGFMSRKFLGKAAEEKAFPESPGEETASLLDQALQRMGKLDMDGARALLKQVLDREPENTKALTQLFHIDKLNPECERFHTTASRLLLRLCNDRTEHASVSPVFQEYSRLSPRLRLGQHLLCRIGSLLASQGHPEEGERILAALIRKEPRAAGIPTGILHLARAYLNMGKSEKGRKCLQVICQRYPESGESQLARKLLDGLAHS